jgi:alpha-amylase
VYSNSIAGMVLQMGYKTMLTEGAKQMLGWKSPNYLYCSAPHPRLKVLLRNYQLSDDITFRFSQQDWSEWPLTADKFVGWLNNIDPKQELVNLFMDYETFGEHQKAESGIFGFLRAFPEQVIKTRKWVFNTATEVADEHQPVAGIDCPHAISWADEERDLTAWLGNDLQDEAFSSLYKLSGIMADCKDEDLHRDWNYLQASDHFYYMCTKWFSDGAVHHYFTPYATPYEAFLNYMNVLSDFMIRVKEYAEKAPVVVEKANAKMEVEKNLSTAKKEIKTNSATTVKPSSSATSKAKKK